MNTGISPQQPALPTAEELLQQAIAHHQAGRLQDAERLYHATLQAHPNYPEANFGLGTLANQLEEPTMGLPYFKAALQTSPNQGPFWLSYIDALIRTGQTNAAGQVLEQGRQRGLRGEAVEALAVRIKKHAGCEASPQEMNALATLFNEGRTSEASTLAFELTERFPQHGFGWKVLGELLKRMGRNDDALASMQKSAALSPIDTEAHYNLGIALHGLGRSDEAEASYRRALQIKPDFAEAHNSLGVTLHELGRLDEAEASYRRALQIKPDFADAHGNLGNALKELGRLDDAAASCHRTVQIKPDYAEAHYNLGNILHELGRHGEAEASYRRTLQITPDFAQAHYNLGIILNELDKPDEAETSYRLALQIKPDYAEAHSNLGNALHALGRLDEAEASYRWALQIKPDFAEAHYNLGHTLLLSAKLLEGWRKYEYRWEKASPKPPRPITSLPQWTGQPPQIGDRILIFGEQGIGDQLQFSRYRPLVADRFAGGVSIFAGHSLQALFRRSFPDVEVLESFPIDQSAWQWQCPLLSLPLAFNTTLETIPQRIPYLVSEPTLVAYWKNKIAALDLPTSTRKIGVVWKTGSIMKNAPLRSLTLQQLAPLLNLPGCAWFSLQKEYDPDKTSWVASGKLIDWSDAFGSFDETAALAVNLDLVISVDTAVAHLAGGLDRPIWLFNRHASEWRWMRDREDSPWYPTMRLFTQKIAADWNEVVSRVTTALGGSA